MQWSCDEVRRSHKLSHTTIKALIDWFFLSFVSATSHVHSPQILPRHTGHCPFERGLGKKPFTTSSTDLWQAIAYRINQTLPQNEQKRVTKRSCRERFNHLMKLHQKGEMQSLKAWAHLPNQSSTSYFKEDCIWCHVVLLLRFTKVSFFLGAP